MRSSQSLATAALLSTTLAQFVPAPTDLIEKLGYANVSVRYKDSKTGTMQTYEGAAIDAPYSSIGGLMQSAPKVAGENYNGGLYPLTAEAYTVAAKKIGILPSQLQATVWIQIRDVDKGAR